MRLIFVLLYRFFPPKLWLRWVSMHPTILEELRWRNKWPEQHAAESRRGKGPEFAEPRTPGRILTWSLRSKCWHFAESWTFSPTLRAICAASTAASSTEQYTREPITLSVSILDKSDRVHGPLNPVYMLASTRNMVVELHFHNKHIHVQVCLMPFAIRQHRRNGCAVLGHHCCRGLQHIVPRGFVGACTVVCLEQIL